MDWHPAMRRLGKSVQELARETAEEILGFAGTGDETVDALEGTGGHKPPRADIQKMKDVYDLYNRTDAELQGGDAAEIQSARDEWNRDYLPSKQEQSFIDAYTHMFKYNGAQKAFEQLGRLIQMGMIKDGELPGGEDAATEPLPPEVKRAAGALLKKYEERHYVQLYPAIVRTLTKLEREHPESYKLWPWAIKQMKAEYQERLESGSISNTPRGGLRFDHLADIVGEGGALLNRLRAENRLPQGLDVNRINFDEFETWLMQWKRDNREQEAQGEIVYQYDDGWTMQKLTTPEQLQFEGDEMGHCVGGYSHSVGDGRTIIYSLRDPKGMPHVTMEINALEGPENLQGWKAEDLPEDAIYNHSYIHPDQHAPGDHFEDTGNYDGYRPTGETPFEVVQVQGNSNKTPKPEYQHKVKDFLDYLRAKGWKFVRSDEWFAPFDDPAQGEYGNGAPSTAQELDEWYDNHYKTHHEQYRGVGDRDAYGLPAERPTIGISDWDDLFKSCFSALVTEYDPGRWRGRPEDLAQAVYHAWAVDIYKDKLDPEALKQHEENLVKEIQSAEETLHEWNDHNWMYAEEHVRDEIAEAIKEEAQKRGEWAKIEQALNAEYGEDMWDEDELGGWVHDNEEDLYYHASDAIRDRATDDYAGDAYKFVQYLIFLAEKHGMVNPADLPDPNQRNGGLPSYEELEQMPWKTDERVPTNTGETPVEEGLPGALSKTATTLYHISPRRHRDSIMQQGLVPMHDMQDFVPEDQRRLWVFTDPETARAYAGNSWGGSGGDNDLWTINGEGLELEPDRDRMHEHAMMTRQTIPPDRIRLAANDMQNNVEQLTWDDLSPEHRAFLTGNNEKGITFASPDEDWHAADVRTPAMHYPDENLLVVGQPGWTHGDIDQALRESGRARNAWGIEHAWHAGDPSLDVPPRWNVQEDSTFHRYFAPDDADLADMESEPGYQGLVPHQRQYLERVWPLLQQAHPSPLYRGLHLVREAKVSSDDNIQIHPIDQEHNVWFDEDGNQRERYRAGWAKDPATGKMVQTGQPEDTFLDKQGRQGEGYVAYHGDHPVGSLTYVSDPNGWHMIGTTFVHPDYREQGLFNRMAAPLRETGQPIDAYVWNNPWLKQKVRGWQHTASIPDDQRVYIAEGALTRGGLAGPVVSTQNGHPNHPNPEGVAESQRVSELASQVVGRPITVHITDWINGSDGAHGEYDRMFDRIAIRPGEPLLTLLHECAHVLSPVEGHGPEFIDVASRLYTQHLGEEAGRSFRKLATPPLPTE